MMLDEKTDQRLIAALTPLVGKISIEAMRRANFAVDGRKQAPAQAATGLEREISAAR